MPLKNSENQYGSVTKSFHWVMALLIFCLLLVGFFMGDLPLNATKLQVYNLHKSFGISVLALAFCRLCWHMISKKPGFIGSLKPWEKKLAAAIHVFLYTLMFAMPLSGWMLSSAAGRPVSFFGLFTLPNLLAANKELAETFKEVHETIAWLIIVTVALHALAALKHHFLDKDQSLRRMLPALLIILFAFPAQAADAPWIVDQAKSSIAFTGKQMGAEFKGRFSRFRADIVFDPGHLDASSVKVSVDIASADSQSAERDESLKGKEWFDIAQFPAARFETTALRKTGDDAYEASANLTIRDVTLPVKLPFKLNIIKADSDKRSVATMDASITLDRSKFHLGTGSWADTSVIANEVPVDIHVVATQDKSAP